MSDGNELKELRVGLGVSRKALAAELGCSRQSIAQLEGRSLTAIRLEGRSLTGIRPETRERYINALETCAAEAEVQRRRAALDFLRRGSRLLGDPVAAGAR